jgi:hypothetical protein
MYIYYRPFMCETCGKTFRDAYSVKGLAAATV